MVDSLSSWNDGAAKDAIVSFVERACAAGSADTIPVADRVAVFDNDGTLWCEKPMPIQLDFILRRLAEMAKTDAELRNRQPWKAAYDRDYGWLASVIAEHYAGDDTNVPTVAGGILAAFANITVDEFEAQSDAFLRGTSHPTLGRTYLDCAYTADGPAPGPPRSEWLHELHRLRRRSRLREADQRRRLQHPARAGDRE